MFETTLISSFIVDDEHIRFLRFCYSLSLVICTDDGMFDPIFFLGNNRALLIN